MRVARYSVASFKLGFSAVFDVRLDVFQSCAGGLLADLYMDEAKKFGGTYDWSRTFVRNATISVEGKERRVFPASASELFVSYGNKAILRGQGPKVARLREQRHRVAWFNEAIA